MHLGCGASGLFGGRVRQRFLQAHGQLVRELTALRLATSAAVSERLPLRVLTLHTTIFFAAVGHHLLRIAGAGSHRLPSLHRHCALLRGHQGRNLTGCGARVFAHRCAFYLACIRC